MAQGEEGCEHSELSEREKPQKERFLGSIRGGHWVTGLGLMRKKSREKVVCGCVIMHKDRQGQMGGKSHWKGSLPAHRSTLLYFSKCISDLQVRVSGSVPELLASSKIP